MRITRAINKVMSHNGGAIPFLAKAEYDQSVSLLAGGDNSKVRELELFSVDPNSGGFQFNFKGANSDGIESMPLSFTAKLNSAKTTGRQLFSYKVDSGAM